MHDVLCQNDWLTWKQKDQFFVLFEETMFRMKAHDSIFCKRQEVALKWTRKMLKWLYAIRKYKEAVSVDNALGVM